VRAQALRAAGSEATSAHDREHVMPFLYNHPERFSLASITRTPKCSSTGKRSESSITPPA